MAKKSNVFLKTPYNYHAGEVKPCGYWSPDDINNFLEQLKNTDIPHESCVFSIYATMHQNVSRGRTYKKDNNSLIISINPANQKCKIRDEKNCIKCIASGKCRDEFVIDLIGKKLFADKYEKQK
ncbi:MAG: hypothetical protein J6W41_02785 [Alphaproteobacteria bacterium]|nr:hypothetical protein [Alphaproteobacteria bacterium]